MAAAALSVVDASHLAEEFGKLSLDGLEADQQAKVQELGKIFPGMTFRRPLPVLFVCDSFFPLRVWRGCPAWRAVGCAV